MKQSILILTVLLGGLFFTSCEKAKTSQASMIAIPASSSFVADYTKVGDVVPDFSLKNIDGTMVSLKNYPNAKGFIIVFTSNVCPYAGMIENRINALAAEYQPKGWQVIAINGNDDSIEPKDNYEAMQKAAKEKNFSYPYLYDGDNSVTSEWEVVRLPQVYVVQKTADGNILQYTGAIDDSIRDAAKAKESYVRNVINDLEAGNEIRVTTTRSFGCTIKTK